MRRILTLAAAIMLFAPAPASAGASGYSDTGFDPDDVQGVRVVDVRSSTRNVWRDDEGNRWLSITIRSHDRLGPHWSFRVYLDSSRGGRHESRMDFTKLYAAAYCDWFVGGSGSGGQLSIFERRVRCRIPLRDVRPTKPIRWRVVDAGRGDDEELAPDTGWYV